MSEHSQKHYITRQVVECALALTAEDGQRYPFSRLFFGLEAKAHGGDDDEFAAGREISTQSEYARTTLRLLRHNPFPDDPPQYVRAQLYRYRFTTPAELRRDHAWWHRTLEGGYAAPMSLDRTNF